MSQLKDFDAARREAIAEPLEFQLGGEVFKVPTPVPVLPIMDLAAHANDDESDGDAMAAATVAFRDCLLSLIDEGDHARFRRACAAARADIGLLRDITQWAIAEATGRPIQPPSDSSGRRPTTSPSSTDD